MILFGICYRNHGDNTKLTTDGQDLTRRGLLNVFIKTMGEILDKVPLFKNLKVT